MYLAYLRFKFYVFKISPDAFYDFDCPVHVDQHIYYFIILLIKLVLALKYSKHSYSLFNSIILFYFSH